MLLFLPPAGTRQIPLSQSSVPSSAVTAVPVPRARAGSAAVLALVLTLVLLGVPLPGSGARAGAVAVTGARGTCQQVLQVVGNRLDVPKVAESSLATLPHLKLAAAGLSEVCNRTEVAVDGAEHVPAVVEIFSSLHSILLATELDVHVPSQVVTLVVTHAHLFNFPILILTLEEHILKEVLELLLDLVVAHVGQVGAVC